MSLTYLDGSEINVGDYLFADTRDGKTVHGSVVEIYPAIRLENGATIPNHSKLLEHRKGN